MGRLIDETDLMNLLWGLDDARHDLRYAISKIPELSTAKAIPRKQIDEMIAEIRDYSNKYTTINVDTKKVVVEALLCIIHKYCDKEQTDES